MQTFDQNNQDPLIDLSQNEARVLHSLVRWPDLTDQAIHSEIGMKKSTFSSIKTRLKEQDYYSRLFIPNFPSCMVLLTIRPDSSCAKAQGRACSNLWMRTSLLP